MQRFSGHLYTPRVSLWDATTTTISVIWKKINAEVDTWTVAAFEYDRGRPEDFSDPVDVNVFTIIAKCTCHSAVQNAKYF